MGKTQVFGISACLHVSAVLHQTPSRRWAVFSPQVELTYSNGQFVFFIWKGGPRRAAPANAYIGLGAAVGYLQLCL